MTRIRMSSATIPTDSQPTQTAAKAIVEQTATFIVTSGVNAGSTYNLTEKTDIHCGTDIDNDVILSGDDLSEAWQIRLIQEHGTVFLTVLDGEVTGMESNLVPGQQISVARDNEFTVGALSFTIKYPKLQTTDGHKKRLSGSRSTSPAASTHSNPGAIKYALYIFSILCIALGVLSGMYAVTGSLILANADTGQTSNRFLEAINKSELAYLEVRQIGDSNKYQVSGTVDSREERNQLTRIARETGTDVTVQLQVNDVVLESIEDIFRVNGIQAQAEISANGGIEVLTQTTDTNKLESVHQIVRRDIPSINMLEIKNTPPVLIATPKKGRFTPSPEKRITLISAGSNAYIMTEDKSRYFVGALLPSGHLVEEIKKGAVIVSMNGKLETLKY